MTGFSVKTAPRVRQQLCKVAPLEPLVDFKGRHSAGREDVQSLAVAAVSYQLSCCASTCSSCSTGAPSVVWRVSDSVEDCCGSSQLCFPAAAPSPGWGLRQHPRVRAVSAPAPHCTCKRWIPRVSHSGLIKRSSPPAARQAGGAGGRMRRRGCGTHRAACGARAPRRKGFALDVWAGVPLHHDALLSSEPVRPPR